MQLQVFFLFSITTTEIKQYVKHAFQQDLAHPGKMFLTLYHDFRDDVVCSDKMQKQEVAVIAR